MSCWSSVSGSGRTHQLRADTYANRHNQQVMSLVSHNTIAASKAVQDRHPSNWAWAGLDFIQDQETYSCCHHWELLHIREKINLRRLLRWNVSQTRYGYRVRLRGFCAVHSTTTTIVVWQPAMETPTERHHVGGCKISPPASSVHRRGPKSQPSLSTTAVRCHTATPNHNPQHR